jgi:hypothetical protein
MRLELSCFLLGNAGSKFSGRLLASEYINESIQCDELCKGWG